MSVHWDVIASYFKDPNMLVRHQIESYNHFIHTQLPNTIKMFNPMVINSYSVVDQSLSDDDEEEEDAVDDSDDDEVSGAEVANAVGSEATNKTVNRLQIYITFDNLKIYRPQIHENNGAVKTMFPQEARNRNFTYAATTTVDLNIQYIVNGQTFHKHLPNINMGKIPIMVKSSICVLSQCPYAIDTGECIYDTGGYFIIKGSEKTVLGQERAAENTVYCFHEKADTKYSWKAEIKSIPDYKCISPKQIKMYIVNKHNGYGHPIVVEIPRSNTPIPLFILFRAMGVTTDKEICNLILPEEDDLMQFLIASIMESGTYLTQKQCVEHIMTTVNTFESTKKYSYVMNILMNDLFPHCNNLEQKICFLGYMTRKLILAYFEINLPDDRDAIENKRVDITGTIINNLYRNAFNRCIKDMEKNILREIKTGSWRSTDDYLSIITMSNIYKLKSNCMEKQLNSALLSGDFTTKKGGASTSKVGVAQVFNRLNRVASISHLKRISTPIEKNGKLVLPRKLHSTSYGYICPAETPEGASVGVVKNLSILAHITIPSCSITLYKYIMPLINTHNHTNVKVFINGVWLGTTQNPFELYHTLKEKKYAGVINIYTSIVFDMKGKEIRVCNDGGRLSRPLFRVKNGSLLLNEITLEDPIVWNDLLTNCKYGKSVIEYIDAEEQKYAFICNKPSEITRQHTHCEIHPSVMFGVLASCIPFPDYNQSPRNTYQCAQGKQAIGIYASNHKHRYDKTGYILEYPMRPLVETRVINILGLDKNPSGSQLIVAIMTHGGYNQEDSILINQGSIDRGMTLSTIYHTELDEDKQKTNGNEEMRCKPNPSKTKGFKLCNYSKVGNDGLVPEGTLIEDKDILISKVNIIKDSKNPNIKYEDQSKIYKTQEDTYVDTNYTDKNGEGYNFVKVKLRTLRKPVIGDKFSSRHGQKGTVGNIIPECDMPYTANGLKPDIIINPHAIPSRMTIGQLNETLLGKVLVSIGCFGDGTAYEQFHHSKLKKWLLHAGYNSSGDEIMYNGQTGEQFNSSVFIGPVYYQRLKHMVNDKAHSRATGPMLKLTRQPTEGKSRNGGSKFGEMERDCTIGHGASRFTQERMYYVSDKYSVYTCNCCGSISSYNSQKRIYLCRMCDNRSDFSLVNIPYSCKLLFQELNTMNIAPRIITDNVAIHV